MAQAFDVHLEVIGRIRQNRGRRIEIPDAAFIQVLPIQVDQVA